MADLSLAFDILARDKNASRTFDKVGDSAEKAGKKGSGFGTMIKGAMGIAAGAIAAAGIGDFFKDSIAEARESQKVGALTAQVLKSTGGAAKISAAQVGDLATAISNKSGIDDEAIQSGANLLLTFKNIRNEAGKGNDIFSQTTQIMTDVSAAMGQEPKAAAIQLGKALNDPVKGIAQLNRIGVTFSDSQKKVIKRLVETGDVAGAQKVILRELQSEFGGAAAASSTMGEKAGVAFGNLKEQIGTALLPIIDKVAGYLTEKVIPAVSQFIAELQNGEGTGGRVAAVFKDVGSVLSDVAGFVQRNLDVIGPVVAILGAMAGAFGIVMGVVKAYTAVQAALNFVMSANPIGIIVVAIAGLVTGLVIAYQRSETFRDIVNGALHAVADAGKFMWDSVLKPAFDGLKAAFKAVGDAANFLWDKVFRPVFKLYADAWLTVVGVIVHGAAAAFGWVPGVGPKLKSAAKEFDKLRDRVDASLDGIGDEAEGYGTDWANGLARGIRANANVPVAVAQGVANKIAAATRQAMRTGSPSKVAAELGGYWSQGLAQGVDSGGVDVVRSATRVASSLPTATAAALPQASAASHPLATGDGGYLRLHPDDMRLLARLTGGQTADSIVGAGSRQQLAGRNGVAR